MRHPILTTILALATVQGFAQDIEGCYSYRIGEKVEKQTVEYAAEAEAAEDTVWDLQDMKELDRTHRVAYTEVYERDRLNIVCQCHREY